MKAYNAAMFAADQCFVFIEGIRNEPQEEFFSAEEELDMMRVGSSLGKTIPSVDQS